MNSFWTLSGKLGDKMATAQNGIKYIYICAFTYIFIQLPFVCVLWNMENVKLNVITMTTGHCVRNTSQDVARTYHNKLILKIFQYIPETRFYFSINKS